MNLCKVKLCQKVSFVLVLNLLSRQQLLQKSRFSRNWPPSQLHKHLYSHRSLGPIHPVTFLLVGLLELTEWHPTKVSTAHLADQLTAGTAQRHQAATRTQAVPLVVIPVPLTPARPYVVFLPHGALNPQ